MRNSRHSPLLCPSVDDTRRRKSGCSASDLRLSSCPTAIGLCPKCVLLAQCFFYKAFCHRSHLPRIGNSKTTAGEHPGCFTSFCATILLSKTYLFIHVID